MTTQQHQQPNETELKPASGWVGIGVITVILLAATVTGTGDYARELEAERDQLRERVAQLEMAAPIRDACWRAIAKGEVAP